MSRLNTTALRLTSIAVQWWNVVSFAG